jgi:hypothetical protein
MGSWSALDFVSLYRASDKSAEGKFLLHHLFAMSLPSPPFRRQLRVRSNFMVVGFSFPVFWVSDIAVIFVDD